MGAADLRQLALPVGPGVGVGGGVGTGVFDGFGSGVGVLAGTGVRLGVGAGVRVGFGAGVRVGAGLGVGVGVGVGVGLGVGVGVFAGVAFGLGLGRGFGVAVRSAVGAGTVRISSRAFKNSARFSASVSAPAGRVSRLRKNRKMRACRRSGCLSTGGMYQSASPWKVRIDRNGDSRLLTKAQLVLAPFAGGFREPGTACRSRDPSLRSPF